MADTPAPGTHYEINNLMVDKRLADYRDQKELHYFWDLFAMCISPERIEKELAENSTKYYGNKVEARNSLIRRDLEEKWLLKNARTEYAKITCEKILLFFRKMVFSWSEGGKNFAHGDNNIEHYKHLPVTYFSDLYSQDIREIEEQSELIDDTVVKMIDEFHAFEAVKACARFYHSRPNIGKNMPIYRDCMSYISDLAKLFRECENNETYFQNAANRIKQYRDMLDPVKEIAEDFKIFIGAADKTTSQIRHDVEDTLTQYVKTLILFTQMQTKGTKEEVKNDMNSFLRETDYTIEKLGFEIIPTYKNTMDKLMFKKSGWQLSPKAKK